jgi:phosphoribosylanthranilate isomerase
MPIDVKICGINDKTALRTAVEAGAAYVGFVFYPRSPRSVTLEAAHKFVNSVPAHVVTVGLLVDPTDDELRQVPRLVPSLGMIQLHGKETPARVAEARLLSERPVMKAIGISSAADLDQVKDYVGIADQFLFDAKPAEGALPGGNAVAFDWALLKGYSNGRPWLLAGGLNAQNLAEAVRQSGARGVDVSSGVEDRPGHKDQDKICEFIGLADRI